MSTSPFSVSLKRIIAVDSASFAYVEVPLNLNIVLLGTGNLGKSSLVNAVRFFFLPDINVNDADKKFGFISGSNDSSDVTYFTKDQIYDHYFPTDDSRLILEVEHTLVDGSKRSHCQVISRGGNYRLLRAFIPEPYQQIQHLFWDKRTDAGGIPVNKPGQHILAELRKVNPVTKQFNQVDQLVSALYSVDILRPDQCPFVIFPMNDVRANSVNSIRALIKMLFNQDGSSLRLMTSTAIEAKTASQDVLELDIGEIINEQKGLQVRRDELNRLKSIEPGFAELQQQFTSIVKEVSAAEQFATLWLSAGAAKQKAERDSRKLSADKGTFEQQLKCLNEQREEMSKLIYSHNKRLADIKKRLDAIARHEEDCERLCQPYLNFSVDEVIDTLKDELADTTEKLKEYTDQSARNSKIEYLDSEIRSVEQKISVLQNKAQNASYSLQAQLDRDVWEKLQSINGSLSKANPGRALDASESTAIHQFSDLLTANNGELQFFDETIPLIKAVGAHSIEDDIDDARAKLTKLKQERKELASLSSQSTPRVVDEIKKLQSSKNLLEADIQKLEDRKFKQRDVEALNTEYQEKSEEKAAEKAKIAGTDDEYQRLTGQVTDVKEQLDNIQKSSRHIDGLMGQFNYVKTRFESVKQALNRVSASAKVDETTLPQQDDFSAITAQLEQSEKAKHAIYRELCSLLNQRIMEDHHGLLTGNDSADAITKTFGTLSTLIESINQNEDVLTRDTQIHNDYVRNRLQHLSTTKDSIELTVANINAELAKARVNNLDGVRLNVILHSHFEYVITTWREFDDMSGDGTLPEFWYARLQKFLDSDAVSKDGKLRMENIIQMARYQTKKDGATWDDKDQSTSTKMLINMHLCDIFIQQLSNATSHIAFPLIMDEVGKVSSEQFPDLIQGLNKKGHWLIGVTTHGKSGDLIAPFSHHLVMDEAETAKPYHKKRRHVCFPLDVIEGLMLKEQPDLLAQEA